jgi:peptidoglycan/LPS O-acetylase OafA/YrhL
VRVQSDAGAGARSAVHQTAEPRSSAPQKVDAVVESIPRSVLDGLNWMRGLSAIAVFVNHFRGAFLVDYGKAARTPLNVVFYLLTGAGHQAVNVFFVLSGFFIGTSVVVSSRKDAWSWERFALRRFTRLYTVLIPALVITALLDHAGTTLFGFDGIYGGQVEAAQLRQPDVRGTSSLVIFLGNLAFLQNIFVPPYGSDFPLWSLGYEFWAYITFPLLFRAVLGSESRVLRLGFVFVAAALLAVGGGEFRFYFCIWLLGALVAISWMHGRWRVPFAALVGALIVFSGAILVGRLRLLKNPQLEDLAVGLGSALLVAALLGRSEAARGAGEKWRHHYSWLGEGVAGFSYTLYVIHVPMLTFLQAWLVGRTQWHADPLHVAATCGIGVLVVAGCVYPFARLTEGRTDQVRRFIERRLSA